MIPPDALVKLYLTQRCSIMTRPQASIRGWWVLAGDGPGM